MNALIEKSILIEATPVEVWRTLTDVTLMAGWMGDPELKLEISTSWEPGSPMSIKGFHHLRFENKGTVLEYAPYHLLSYDFLSSLSRLPDQKENYTIVRFELTPQADHTNLSLTLANFPAETIYQHLNFYWNTTLVLLKRRIEARLIEQFPG